MANVERTYSTLDIISTLKKREVLIKKRAFNENMLLLSQELTSQAGVVEAMSQDKDLSAVLGVQAVKAYRAGAAAFLAAHRCQFDLNETEQRAVLSLMHHAFSLARAIDGNNGPNTAYYSLFLVDAATDVLNITLA